VCVKKPKSASRDMSSVDTISGCDYFGRVCFFLLTQQNLLSKPTSLRKIGSGRQIVKKQSDNIERANTTSKSLYIYILFFPVFVLNLCN